MNEQDKIKRSAFQKLDDYVMGELSYLVANNLSIESFNMTNMLPDIFSPEEEAEVKKCLQQLQNGKVVVYCACRGIDIPKQLIK